MSILIKGMRMPKNCIKCPMQFGGMCYVMPAEVDESRVAPTVEEALKQGKPDWCPLIEIPESHGDLIDRDAFRADFSMGENCDKCGVVLKHNLDNGWTGGILEALDAVEDLPTAQPEPKEGHWIPHETPDGGEQYECSRCGVLWEFNDGTPEDNEAYFCPKCGAKMKGVKHETD